MSSLLSQLKVFLASLATIAMSITPLPQQGTTATATTASNVGTDGHSRNWSGYISDTGNYTAITGTWTIPHVTTNGHTATDATWVGIGGVTSNDLIQSGTQNVISPSGHVTTTAFYELLPDASIPITALTVNPGDSVTVSINQQSANQWLIKFVDNTTNQSYQNTVTYSSSYSSAEWIEEAPSNGVHVLPLDNFEPVQFSNGSTIQNNSQVSIAASNAHPVTMVNNAGQTLATPSPLQPNGESFSETRSSAVSNPPIPTFDRNPGSWRRVGRGIGIAIQFIRRNRDDTPVAGSSSPTIIPNPTEASRSGIRVIQFPFRKRHIGF